MRRRLAPPVDVRARQDDRRQRRLRFVARAGPGQERLLQAALILISTAKHGVPSSLPHERPRLPHRLRVSVDRGVQLVSPDDALCSRGLLHSTGPGGPTVGSSALLKRKTPRSLQELLLFLRAQRPSRPAIPSC